MEPVKVGGYKIGGLSNSKISGRVLCSRDMAGDDRPSLERSKRYGPLPEERLGLYNAAVTHFYRSGVGDSIVSQQSRCFVL